MSHCARDLYFLKRNVANDVKNMTNVCRCHLKKKMYKNARLRKITQCVMSKKFTKRQQLKEIHNYLCVIFNIVIISFYIYLI